MKKCYIITAYIEGTLSEIISPRASDFIICADGGYETAVSSGFAPNLVIGDSDSGNMTQIGGTVDFIRFPREKDDSDTFLCVKHAAETGFDEIIIAGGIGGRLDHTIANIQTLAYFSDFVKRITMLDEKNFITIVNNSRISILKKEGFTISLFALTDKCAGVTTSGLLYPLNDAELKNTYPIGLSNEFTRGEAIIEVNCGKLLVVMSNNVSSA